MRPVPQRVPWMGAALRGHLPQGKTEVGPQHPISQPAEPSRENVTQLM